MPSPSALFLGLVFLAALLHVPNAQAQAQAAPPSQQQEPAKPDDSNPDHPTPQQRLREQVERPAAVPARPTVTTPATLPPDGYLQFEQGINEAANAANAGGHVDTQFSIVQNTKIALLPRLLVQSITQPFAHDNVQGATPANGSGDVILGTQFLITKAPLGNAATLQSSGREAPKPYPKISAIAIAYNGRIHTGTSADLDIGSYSQSFTALLDAALPGFTFQTNAIFNQQSGTGPGGKNVSRAQYGQTLTASHAFTGLYSTTVELWHFTQPFVNTGRDGAFIPRANAVGLLVSNIFTIHRNLIVDAGIEQGLTSSSTRIQGVAGITYLYSHRLWPLHPHKIP